MDVRRLAQVTALGRMAFGAAMAVAPRILLRSKATSSHDQLVWLARAFGIRDLAIGAATLAALDESAEPGRWVALGAAADSADALAAVVWRRELGPAMTRATVALAAGGAVSGWYAASRLRH